MLGSPAALKPYTDARVVTELVRFGLFVFRPFACGFCHRRAVGLCPLQVAVENALRMKGYKFGVLYAKDGQVAPSRAAALAAPTGGDAQRTESDALSNATSSAVRRAARRPAVR